MPAAPSPSRTAQATEQAVNHLARLSRTLPDIGIRYDDVAVSIVIILDSREVIPADGPLDIASAASVVRRYGNRAIDEGKTLSISLTPVFGPKLFTDAD